MGYGTAVNHDAAVGLFEQAVAREFDALIAYELPERIDLGIGGKLTFFEAKSPGIDQGHNRDIEGTLA